MATTKVDIANLALLRVGQSGTVLTALSDGTPSGDAMGRLFDLTAGLVLKALPWPFATRTVRMQQNTLVTDPEWRCAYTLPPDLQQIDDQTAARESVAINPQALDITENSRKAWEAGGGELIKLPPDQQSTLLQMLSTVGADVSAQKPLLNSAYKIVSDAAQKVFSDR